MPKVWGLIPARLESSRLPGKALMMLHGAPMIVHVAKRAALAKSLDEVIVCTDSVKIMRACFSYDIKVCVTPTICKNGTERILFAKNILQIPDKDLIIDIQGDEPLVDPQSIDMVVSETTRVAENADIVLPHIENCSSTNPNIVKVIASGDKVVYLTRADAPFPFIKDSTLKKHLSIIGFSSRSLDQFGQLKVGCLEEIEGIELLRAIEGGMRVITFPIHVDSFSVDVMADYERAERVLRDCPIFKRGYL